MQIFRLHHYALAAILGLGALSVANAATLSFDLVNPSSSDNLAEITGSLDNVTGELTATFIAHSGYFFDGQYQFDLNMGDPSRGTVIEQQTQNVVFLDALATVSHVSSFTVSEGPGGPDYGGSVVGWQSGDTIITCGDVLAQGCTTFESGIYSFGAGSFVGLMATSGILGDGSQSNAVPEPGYVVPMLVLLAGFVVVRRYQLTCRSVSLDLTGAERSTL